VKCAMQHHLSPYRRRPVQSPPRAAPRRASADLVADRCDAADASQLRRPKYGAAIGSRYNKFARPFRLGIVLKPQSKNFFWLSHSSEEVRTERIKLDSVARRGGELGRDENPVAQWLAQGLDTRYLVDRRSDDREVEAIHRANIAIKHLAGGGARDRPWQSASPSALDPR
jgi:hypothetical protein